MISLDTNILVYSIDELSPFHNQAKSFLNKLVDDPKRLALTWQVLMELYAVVTSAGKRMKISSENAWKFVQSLLASGKVELIYPNNSTYKILNQILTKKKCVGSKVFDLFLAATLLSNDINILVTENTKDFFGISNFKAKSMNEFGMI